MSFLEWELLIAIVVFVLGIRRVLSLLSTRKATDAKTLAPEELSGVKQLSAQLSNLYMLTALGKSTLDQSIDPDSPNAYEAEHYEALELWEKYSYHHRLSLGMSPFEAQQSMLDIQDTCRQALSKYTPQRIYHGCYTFPNPCPECEAAIAKAKEDFAKAEGKLKAGQKVNSHEWPMTISRCRQLANEYPSAGKDEMEYMVKTSVYI
jgi:hypothetical protein